MKIQLPLAHCAEGATRAYQNAACLLVAGPAQNSNLNETWPVRLPPKSALRAELMVPKLPDAMLRFGSPRLVWFRTLVNEAPAFRRILSVIAKALLSPVLRLTVPGPTTTPTPELPKRPIGACVEEGSPPMSQGFPGAQSV